MYAAGRPSDVSHPDVMCPRTGRAVATRGAHALRMPITRDGASTEALDTLAAIAEFPLTFAAPGAEDVGMIDETWEPAVASVQRSRAGLGAISVVIFTVVAYATIFGLVATVGAVRGLAAGQIDVLRSILAPVLLAPAAAVLVFVRRTRRSPTRP